MGQGSLLGLHQFLGFTRPLFVMGLTSTVLILCYSGHFWFGIVTPNSYYGQQPAHTANIEFTPMNISSTANEMKLELCL